MLLCILEGVPLWTFFLKSNITAFFMKVVSISTRFSQIFWHRKFVDEEHIYRSGHLECFGSARGCRYLRLQVYWRRNFHYGYCMSYCNFQIWFLRGKERTEQGKKNDKISGSMYMEWNYYITAITFWNGVSFIKGM